jgi:hypothetical protein
MVQTCTTSDFFFLEVRHHFVPACVIAQPEMDFSNPGGMRTELALTHCETRTRTEKD